MKPNEQYGQVANAKSLDKTAASLKEKGYVVMVAENAEEAKKELLEMLPEGAEIMTMTSTTLEQIGATKEIMESGKYKPVRKELEKMDDKTQGMEKRRLGAAHQFVVGSVHAITEEGQMLIASNTGSQIPSYAYGANKVIWVAGTQKIVKNIDDGMKRLYEYSLPLENERATKAYGDGSAVNKILIINKERQPQRISVILVKEKLGF